MVDQSFCFFIFRFNSKCNNDNNRLVNSNKTQHAYLHLPSIFYCYFHELVGVILSFDEYMASKPGCFATSGK